MPHKLKFSCLIIVLLANNLLPAQVRKYILPENTTYLSSTIIIKLKPDNNSMPQGNLKILKVQEMSKQFFLKSKESIEYNKRKSTANSRDSESKFLSNIYKLTLEEGRDLTSTINELLKYDNVLYAEPLFYEQLLAVPNDPNIGSQDHLSVIKAYEAWDVTTSSSDIVIGIIDTGMQLDHQDLQNQLVSNPAEALNAVDDDGNGFIDDINGWDFADNDNDPSADFSEHGTRVAGISNAQVNNAIGVAGVGYDSRVIPLKIFKSENGVSSNTYNAIIYAADEGYDVINLSWGSVGSFSQFNQDVINYAAVEKNVVIVAAAGNTDAELDFYPASYDNVLSVGASDVDDNKATFGTYSYNVDLMAPGQSVYSTGNDNKYSAAGGSSFSSPQVAGAAALVKAAFPDLNALQIMQQLRITADDIYSVGDNSLYDGKLGKGRLNAFRAVTEISSPSVRMDEFTFSGAFQEKIFFDDTVMVNMQFTNYLRSTNNATATISAASSYVTILSNAEISIGNLNALAFLTDQKLQFYVNKDAPPSERLAFKITFSDDNGYSDFQYFVIELEPDYLFLENGELNFTIASNGNLGYSEDPLVNGYGFLYSGEQIAAQFGVMITNHADSVSNNIINDYSKSSRDTSFSILSNLKLLAYDNSDFYSKSNFDDSKEITFGLGLNVEQEILAWNDTDNSEYLILEYRISNNSPTPKTNLDFGFYADWNLKDPHQNKAAWDAANNLGYVYDGANDLQYAGIALLSNQSATYHAVDVKAENGNSTEIDTVFTKTEKHNLLTTTKLTAGDLSTGNDVANLLGANIGTLNIGNSEKVAYVLTAANTLAELQSNVVKAQAKYDDFIASPPITISTIICVNENLTLTIAGGTSFEVYDNVQMSNLLFSGNGFDLGQFTKDTTIYYRNIDGNFATDISGLRITVIDPMPDFEISADTLYLGDDPLNQVQFTDKSTDAAKWEWDFGNGNLASIQNPTIAFNEAGTYSISLTITSNTGCINAISKTLLVAQRSAIPSLNDQTICFNETVSISSSDATKLKFYINESDEFPVFEGSIFTSGNLTTDTVFYVSSVETTFESLKVAVNIKVEIINVAFNIRLDTLDLTQKNLLLFDNLSNEATAIEWYVNETLIGSNSEQEFTFTNENSLSIKEKIYSALGCADSLTQTIDLKVSPQPLIADTIMVCKFESATVTPQGGSAFYFYSDAALSNLIHKGTFLNADLLTKDSLIFITGVTDFRESEPESVLLRVIPFETEITASPEFLVIEEGRNVTFSSSNSDAINWKWFLESIQVEIVSAPTLKFDTAGIYHIELIVGNMVGCKDTTSLAYEVRHITSIDDAHNEIITYPNPANSILTIQSLDSRTIPNLEFYNALGAKILIDKELVDNAWKIDVSKLPTGLYFLKGEIGDSVFNRKVIIEKE